MGLLDKLHIGHHSHSSSHSKDSTHSSTPKGSPAVPTSSTPNLTNSNNQSNNSHLSREQSQQTKDFKSHVDSSNQLPQKPNHSLAPSTQVSHNSNPHQPVNNVQSINENRHSPSNYSKVQPRKTQGRYSLKDFLLERTLGTGSFGRVHLVRSNHNSRFYAIKVLAKDQVVKMKQVEHTVSERDMLARVRHPFLVNLWGTFQDPKNLYMVMDFVAGGELFSLLRKSQVRLQHDSSHIIHSFFTLFLFSASQILLPNSMLLK